MMVLEDTRPQMAGKGVDHVVVVVVVAAAAAAADTAEAEN